MSLLNVKHHKLTIKYEPTVHTHKIQSMKERLSAAMEAARLSQAELARRLDVTPVAVNAWLSGRNKPDTENLLSIAMETGVSIEWLAFGSGEMVRTPRVGEAPLHYPVGLAKDERELLETYRQSSPIKRRAIIDLLKE